MKRIALQVQLSPEERDSLEKIMEITGNSSLSSTIRQLIFNFKKKNKY